MIFNKFVVEILIADFSPDWTRDNSIASVRGNALIILIQVALIGAGSFLVLRRPKIRITWGNLALLSGGTVAALVIVEIMLNVWIANFASTEDLVTYGTLEHITQNDQLKISSDRYLGYINTPNYASPEGNRHNSLGFRGDDIAVPKPGGVFRIALVGGSTTYTTQVEDYTQSYPFLLQTMLQDQGYDSVEVVNAGVQSYSSWESLINLQFRVLDIEPDLIIVYHGINDAVDRFVFPLSAYRGDNSGSRNPLIGTADTVWDHFLMTRIARQTLGFRTSEKWLRTYRTVDTNRWLEYKYGAEKFYGSHDIGQESISAKQLLKRNGPVYFERNLRNMNATAEANGIPLVLMTFAFSIEASENQVLSRDELPAALEESNAMIRGLCDSSSARCYDFAIEMPLDKALWAIDGIHVNVDGAHKKAELVARYLAESDLISSDQLAN